MSSFIEVAITKDPGCEDIPLPEYHSSGASGVDLHAAVGEEINLNPGQVSLVPTGLRIAVPDGFEAQIRPRSGLALKKHIGILNSPGTIDSDYRGPLGIIMINLGSESFTIKRGDRIAQMVFTPVVKARLNLVEQIDETHRGEGGFGHTGI